MSSPIPDEGHTCVRRGGVRPGVTGSFQTRTTNDLMERRDWKVLKPEQLGDLGQSRPRRGRLEESRAPRPQSMVVRTPTDVRREGRPDLLRVSPVIRRRTIRFTDPPVLHPECDTRLLRSGRSPRHRPGQEPRRRAGQHRRRTHLRPPRGLGPTRSTLQPLYVSHSPSVSPRLPLPLLPPHVQSRFYGSTWTDCKGPKVPEVRDKGLKDVNEEPNQWVLRVIRV